jgi:hypothetical protein
VSPLPATADYYARTWSKAPDGTPQFGNDRDRANEHQVAALLEQSWRCSINSFGSLSPVDWYAERHGRLIGLLELKCRTHPKAKYPAAFLNVRKWLSLSWAAFGLCVPAILVVRFTDSTLWVPLNRIDAQKTVIGGCLRIVKSANDIEPIVMVPVASMRELK